MTRTILIGILSLIWFDLIFPDSLCSQVISNPAKRWSKKGKGGLPSFSRHIVPLFTKAGCNNRACHGSFQGKGGFQLSLFGYEPSQDYRQVKGNYRIDPKRVDSSLILQKPLEQVAHKGGKRFDEGSWQHRMLRHWITDGAKYQASKEAKLIRLEILPSKLNLQPNQSLQLKVVALFDDGRKEEVTPLTLFSTNDESVIQVNEAGWVTSKKSGNTAVVAKYSSGIGTVPVVVPLEADGEFPKFPLRNQIDVLVANKLQEIGIYPSEMCKDEEFLRRVYVDTIGTLPTANEVRQFLQDDYPNKRREVIDRLLSRPEYSQYWATLFSDWLGNNQSNINNFFKMTCLVHDWLNDKLAKNIPYNDLVGGIVTATSREGRPLKEYLEENKTIAAKIKERTGFDDGTYSKRKTLDLFWLRRVPDRPKELAIRTANAFLGVQIQCAECHNHPFDRWTKADFEGFTSFFRVVDIRDLDGSERSSRRYDYHLVALYPIPSKRYRGLLKKYPPKILGGPIVPYREKGKDPRKELFTWMTSPKNPFFARNIVNRLWHHYFGVGIVDPVDDLNEANPPSNPELLDWLAKDFIDHGYDLKHLHRRILSSRTYQLSHRPNKNNRTDKRNFSHALLRRMPAEVALDALAQVTGTKLVWNSYAAPPETRAIGLAASVRFGKSEYFMQIFGRPKRQQTCACERSNEASLAQALFLLNDADVHARIGSGKGRLAKLLKTISGNRKLIEELYLTCLSRYPSPQETNQIIAHIGQSNSRREAMEDVLWSLINVREFIFVR